MGASAVLFLLLLLLCNSAFAEFWNIDCGAAEGFLNSTTKLNWVGDGEYVRGGESHTVANTTDLETPFQTLRAFTRNKKNCYTIPVGAQTKIRVRVSFYYGNYDRLAKPPSFQLMFDSTDWETVTTHMSGNVYKELNYVTERNHTNICLWRLHEDQVPFVSAIQVRTLEPRMYTALNDNSSLYSPRRYAFGANQTIRSPDDSYDRIWIPIDTRINISDNVIRQSKATAINTSTSVDNPPSKLFENAISAPGKSQNLTITTSFVSPGYRMYLNMYFSEILELNPTTEKREFHVYINDALISGPFPITPPLASVFELPSIIPKVTKATKVTLAPTAGSTLPPIVSGFEILYVWTFSRGGIDDRDMAVLSWLQGNFSVLQNWTGDPCLPASYTWEWVRCNSDDSPRITKLYLGGFGLSGDIPDFRALDAIETIDVQHNNLSGSVPEFFGNFPKLRVLNLAYNDFYSIPAALTKSTTILLNVTGNPKLCKTDKICIYSPYSSNSTSPSPPSNGSIKDMVSSIPLLLTMWASIVMFSM